MTFIPAIAIYMDPTTMNPEEAYLAIRVGYQRPTSGQDALVLFGRLTDPVKLVYDPVEWGETSRTMKVAHEYIAAHWNDLKTGAVVDVELILGESTQAKVSERLTDPILEQLKHL